MSNKKPLKIDSFPENLTTLEYAIILPCLLQISAWVLRPQPSRHACITPTSSGFFPLLIWNNLVATFVKHKVWVLTTTNLPVVVSVRSYIYDVSQGARSGITWALGRPLEGPLGPTLRVSLGLWAIFSLCIPPLVTVLVQHLAASWFPPFEPSCHPFPLIWCGTSENIVI